LHRLKISRKEFMSQHWYYCHSCKMVDRIGCCTVCAKVCHAGHDISYAKYGSFFCDCGAKEDESCQALCIRDNTSTHTTATAIQKSTKQPPTAPSSPKPVNVFDLNLNLVFAADANRVKSLKTRQIESLRQSIVDIMKTNRFVDKTKAFIDSLLDRDEVVSTYDRTLLNTLSSSRRSQLSKLKLSDKTVELNEQLFIPTLGSQEGKSCPWQVNLAPELIVSVVLKAPLRTCA
jgi:E3 ubiquitin-protein ligase UBR4